MGKKMKVNHIQPCSYTNGSTHWQILQRKAVKSLVYDGMIMAEKYRNVEIDNMWKNTENDKNVRKIVHNYRKMLGKVLETNTQKPAHRFVEIGLYYMLEGNNLSE